MSHSFHDPASTNESVLSLAERRQRLAVLCALDRARLRVTLSLPRRSAEAAPGEGANDGLQAVLGAVRFLPGKLGVWSRRAGLAASIFRILR